MCNSGTVQRCSLPHNPIMGGSWRFVFALLSAFIAGNTAFVVKLPLGGGRGAATTRSLSATSPRTATGGASRVTWTCLAPGGKVGRAKVSLERAVTSVTTPKPEQKQEQQVKKTTKTKRSTEVDEAPMFKVLVIGDEEYNREHVVLSIQDIVPDTDNTRAAEIFEEAQKDGKGMCGIYPEEQAELYVEQFTRCEPIVYADMEKEGKQPKAGDGAAS